ncbi:hypothetical protein C8F04DRAFT_1253167 [Mycena alexandri]|uniref:Uncharacterized protein n=1 Tax=Mycena alexandri TaxID=1745969 RepID=A0AAD6TBV8_9AGAR|nr:hypothetical protein C8F04DRAFT_1253167 [Mycena alexandri]
MVPTPLLFVPLCPIRARVQPTSSLDRPPLLSVSGSLATAVTAILVLYLALPRRLPRRPSYPNVRVNGNNGYFAAPSSPSPNLYLSYRFHSAQREGYLFTLPSLHNILLDCARRPSYGSSGAHSLQHADTDLGLPSGTQAADAAAPPHNLLPLLTLPLLTH